MDLKEFEYIVEWTCEDGHTTECWVKVTGYTSRIKWLASSAWDFCNECDKPPHEEELKKMTQRVPNLLAQDLIRRGKPLTPLLAEWIINALDFLYWEYHGKEEEKDGDHDGSGAPPARNV